jgi:Sugar (and other) transporter
MQGFGMTNFVFSLFAYYLVDTKGRRWLLLWTFPFMGMCTLGQPSSLTRSALFLLLAGIAYSPVPGLSYAFIIIYTVSIIQLYDGWF